MIELALLWASIEKVWSRAQSLHLYGGDENAWCQDVALPLMQQGAGEDSQRLFKVISMYVTQADPLAFNNYLEIASTNSVFLSVKHNLLIPPSTPKQPPPAFV